MPRCALDLQTNFDQYAHCSGKFNSIIFRQNNVLSIKNNKALLDLYPPPS